MPSIPQLLQDNMALFGYIPSETPVIEPSSLFLTKAGDQIIDRLLTFTRAGREFALRPEFTASAVAQYIAGHEPVVRWQFSGMIFQDIADKPFQYENWSAGAELIGLSGIHGDAEIIAMAARGLEQVGVKDWQITLGHVGLTRYLINRFALDERTNKFILNHKDELKNGAQGKTRVLQALDRYLSVRFRPELEADIASDTTIAEQVLEALLKSGNRGTSLGGRTREDIAQRLVEKSQRAAQRSQIESAIEFLAEWVEISAPVDEAFIQIDAVTAQDEHAWQYVDELKQVIALVEAYGVERQRITIKPDLARTWDYYTGIVFELTTSRGDDLGGGGRYDELIRLIGGQSAPAVGFAYYVDTINQVIQSGTAQQMKPLILVDPQMSPQAVEWLQALRAQNLPVALLPEAPTDTQTALTFDSNSATLRFNDETYTRDNLSKLISRLLA